MHKEIVEVVASLWLIQMVQDLQKRRSKGKESILVYKKRNSLVAEQLFERLIEAIFLRGCDNDFVPAAAGDGPLVPLDERLLKTKYLFSRYERSRAVRSYFHFHDDLPLKRQDKLQCMMVSDPGRPTHRKIRKVVFKKQRLPKQTRQATEMKNVREWINYALKKKSLIFDDQDAAFSFVSSIFNSYRCIDGTNGYIGYPSQLPKNRGTSSTSSRVPKRGINERWGLRKE